MLLCGLCRISRLLKLYCVIMPLNVGILYIVATPIGNMEDITFRAVRLLGEVSLVAAEDTRTARQLLNRYNVKANLTSYHEHNKQEKLQTILDHCQVGDVALISEAGMPGISDPGYELVRAAIEQGITVIAIPGPSAIVAAVSVSGLPSDRFMYLGFLPRKSGERKRFLQDVADVQCSLVCFESPHRLFEALQDIIKVLGNRKMAVCRELTKMHEEIFRGMADDALNHFQQPRGEFTLVIEGCTEQKSKGIDEKIAADLYNLYRRGLGAKESVTILSESSGISRKKLYEYWLQLTKGE